MATRFPSVLALALGAGLLAIGTGMATRAHQAAPTVGLRLIAQGLNQPLALASTADGTGRLLVAEQGGGVRLISNGTLRPEPFLDIRGRISSLDPFYDERGLLGIAVHPRFEQNGRFFVYYSGRPRSGALPSTDHTNYVSEFRVAAGGNRADPSSERVILTLDYKQAEREHQGGQLAFGPDGYLYLGVGDATVRANAQSRESLFGKLLRLDVDRGQPYATPRSNPFVGRPGRDEIYAYGFRNPFHFSFDRAGRHRLFVGDVGGDLREEVDVVVRGGNYGWAMREGRVCSADYGQPALPQCTRTGANREPLREPILDYAHAPGGRPLGGGAGGAVIGGYVYRGRVISQLRGRYVYGDWGRANFERGGSLTKGGTLFAAHELNGRWRSNPLRSVGRRQLLALGEDENGELFVLTADGLTTPADTAGKLWRLVPA